MPPPQTGPLSTSKDLQAAVLFEAAVGICARLGVDPVKLAPVLAARLLETYGIRTRAPLPILLRTLEAWNPSSRVHASRGMLRIVSTECPLSEGDADACRACRGLQRELLAAGLGASREDVEFPQTILGGDSVCELRVHLTLPERPEAAPPSE